jgi:hypothetical protein
LQRERCVSVTPEDQALFLELNAQLDELRRRWDETTEVEEQRRIIEEARRVTRAWLDLSEYTHRRLLEQQRIKD